jgi:hypothetical protein
MNLTLSFFKTAENDLKTAKLLYDHRMYAQAIFYLQQSIEKLSKAFGLKLDLLKPKDIKKVSHHTAQVFTQHMYEDSETVDKRNQSKAQLMEHFGNDFFKFELDGRIIDLATKDAELQEGRDFLELENFEGLNQADLRSCIDWLQEISTTTIELKEAELEQKLPQLYQDLLLQLENKLGKPLPEFRTALNSDLFKKLPKLMIYALPFLIKLFAVLLTLCILSLITTPHNQSTRYPCLHCGESPHEGYLKSTPIVQEFMSIYQLMKRTFQNYKEFEQVEKSLKTELAKINWEL